MTGDLPAIRKLGCACLIGLLMTASARAAEVELTIPDVQEMPPAGPVRIITLPPGVVGAPAGTAPLARVPVETVIPDLQLPPGASPVQILVLPPGLPAPAVPPSGGAPSERPVPAINPTVTGQAVVDCGKPPLALSVQALQDWMDAQHCRWSDRAMSSVNWFDHLFGDSVNQAATTLVRFRNELLWDHINGVQFNSALQASVHLPNADRRLRLVISDDRADFAQGSQNISPLQQLRQDNATTAALRFLAYGAAALRLETDVGLRSGPDLFVRARLRDGWALSPGSAVRTIQTLRYAVEDEGRVISELDLDRLLGFDTTVTLGNQLSYWEKEDHRVAMRWNQGVTVMHSLGDQQAVSFGIGTEGVTRPAFGRESYGVWLLYRHSLYRNWVFWEVEPRLTRYHQYDWGTVPSIALRLELQFGKK